MLIGLLLAFALMGLLPRMPAGMRSSVILLLSAGSIALISPSSLLLCVFTAVVNFSFLGFTKKRVAFALAIVFNVGVLICFHLYALLLKKYSFALLPPLLGISFLSLQYIDHLFRIRHKMSETPRNFLSYLAAVLYLPKFFSGPIATLPAITEQIEQASTTKIYAGLNRILLGLFKKLVLAESLAISVHSVFDFNDAYPGLTILLAAFLYSVQLYLDFSGYSDIAIGASMMWGIELPENFIFPFRQKSWSDFWKSWHASLTGWLWQYIFNPGFLALDRKKIDRRVIYVVCSVFVFAGMAFFNGLQSGFYLSAGLFALFYVTEQLFAIGRFPWRGITIFVLFSFALIFFRNADSETYSTLVTQIFSSNFLPQQFLKDVLAPLASGGAQQDYFNFFFTLLLCCIFLLFERKIFALFSTERIHYIAWFILLLLIFSWGVFDSGERFIYMQTTNY